MIQRGRVEVGKGTSVFGGGENRGRVRKRMGREKGSWKSASNICCYGVMADCSDIACISTAGHRHSCSNKNKCLEYTALVVIISMKIHSEENIFLFYNLLEDRDSSYIRYFRKQVPYVQVLNIFD